MAGIGAAVFLAVMKWLAMFFASFGIGNSVAQAMQTGFGVSPMTTGGVLLVITAPVMVPAG